MLTRSIRSLVVASLAFGSAIATIQPVSAHLTQDEDVVLDATRAAKLEAGLPDLKPGPALVAFLDLQCKSCMIQYPGIQKAIHSMPQMQYLPVQYPLRYHKLAFNASVAAEIAKDHGQYTSTVADFLSGKVSLDVPSLNKYLSAHSMPPIVGTPKSQTYDDRVRASTKFGLSVAINKTPTLLVRDSLGKWHLIARSAQIPAVGV